MHKLGLCLLALAFGFPAAAQEFNLNDVRIPIAELHGLARFHTGDDPHWSEPGFDDLLFSHSCRLHPALIGPFSAPYSI